jgi:hypothetical protein
MHRRCGGGYKCAGGGGVVSINSKFLKKKKGGDGPCPSPPPRRCPSIIPYLSRGRGRGRRGRHCVAIVVAVVVVTAVDCRIDGTVVVVVVVDRAWELFLVCLGSRGQTQAKVTFDFLYLETIRALMAQRLSACSLLMCMGSIPACAYFFWACGLAMKLKYNISKNEYFNSPIGILCTEIPRNVRQYYEIPIGLGRTGLGQKVLRTCHFM